MLHITLKTSGTKSWAVVTADTPRELNILARQSGAEIRQKGERQPSHLDLNPKQIKHIGQNK